MISATVVEQRFGCGRADLNVEFVTVVLDQPPGDRELVGCMLGEGEYFRPTPRTRIPGGRVAVN